MQKKYNLSDFRPETLTTSFSEPKEGYITDRELFFYLNSCPFFHTYNDGRVGELETILLPFFRRFLKVRHRSRSFKTWLLLFVDYLKKRNIQAGENQYKKLVQTITNFYSLMHPSKKFDVLLPYFPYRWEYISGCVEGVVRTQSGIRIYTYDFSDNDLNVEGMNFNGFRLQLAARVFFRLTGLQPTSMGCIYPVFKAVTYYTYNPQENLEEMADNPNLPLSRKYGSYCAYCLQRNCTPLIDRQDKFGWRVSETYK
jgi:hypothetical protein